MNLRGIEQPGPTSGGAGASGVMPVPVAGEVVDVAVAINDGVGLLLQPGDERFDGGSPGGLEDLVASPAGDAAAHVPGQPVDGARVVDEAELVVQRHRARVGRECEAGFRGVADVQQGAVEREFLVLHQRDHGVAGISQGDDDGVGARGDGADATPDLMRLDDVQDARRVHAGGVGRAEHEAPVDAPARHDLRRHGECHVVEPGGAAGEHPLAPDQGHRQHGTTERAWRRRDWWGVMPEAGERGAAMSMTSIMIVPQPSGERGRRCQRQSQRYSVSCALIRCATKSTSPARMKFLNKLQTLRKKTLACRTSSRSAGSAYLLW